MTKEEAAEEYEEKFHAFYPDGMTVASYCNREIPSTCFEAGWDAAISWRDANKAACECGAPVERRDGLVYKKCYACWWAADPRNKSPAPASRDAGEMAYQFVKVHGWKGAPERERLEKCYLAGHAAASAALVEKLKPFQKWLRGCRQAAFSNMEGADAKELEYWSSWYVETDKQLAILAEVLSEMKGGGK